MYRLCLTALLWGELLALLWIPSVNAAPAPSPTATAKPAPVLVSEKTVSASPTPVVAADPKRLVDKISAEEGAKAAELWSTAMEKFAARNFRAAIPLLEEYVNRYPGTPDSIDARYHLAQCYLFSKSPGTAIPSFLAVIEIRGKSDLGNEARTYLGQSYLDASKFTEAYLVSDELLDQKDLGATFRAKALLIRAHAQAGLGQNFEAEKTLVAFQTVAENDPELERETANSFLVSLLLKSNRCDALPSAKALPEDQILDQVARKGICVLEMGTLLAKASKKLSDEEISQAADTLIGSLHQYRQSCEAPPLAAGKLTKAKLTLAKKELTDKLKEGCKNAEKLLLETFRDHDNLKSIILKIQPKESRT